MAKKRPDMTGNDQNKLTPKQEQLIEALLAGHNITVAAKVSSIGDKTARRWLKQEAFQAAYKSAQKALFNQALTGLMLKVDKAIETLERNMRSEEAPASTQVRAAQIILEQAVSSFRMSELEQRVEELKQRVDSSGIGKQS